MTISKIQIPKHTDCLQDQRYDILQWDIHLSIGINKGFSWTFLQRLLKLSTFSVPKDHVQK